MAVIDTKNVIIRFKAGGADEWVEVKLGEGNFTYDEKYNYTYVKNRGRLDTVRSGDEEPVTMRLDARWEFITGGAAEGVVSVEDAVKRRGDAAAWESSSADPCEPYAVDVILKNIVPCEAVDGEELVFTDFRPDTISHDLRGGTISFSGSANVVAPTATRGVITTA